MNLKHSDIEIPEGNPFENCKLVRKQYAEILTQIITAYSSGFVLALNSKWGTGKTTFIKMWRQDLKNNHYKTLYFNAWENDFHDDVIVAFLSELSELRNKNEKAFKNVLDKSAKFVKKIAPIAAKAIVEKAIGENTLSEIAKATTEFTTEELESEISKFSDKKKTIFDFKDSLEKYVAKVDKNKPVIFMIDELDRCRPSYAVMVLEKIKHLFAVPGIIFIISIDKIQLGHAIKGAYGSESIDSDEYLRKFIDIEYKLPEPDRENFITHLLEYYNFDEFWELEDRRRMFQNDRSTFKRVANIIFKKNNSTLRQIENSLCRIRIVLKSFNSSRHIFPELLILLVHISENHYSFFNEMKYSKIKPQKFIDKLDEIIIKMLDEENKRFLDFVYGSILHKYFKQYSYENNYHKQELIDIIPDTGRYKLLYSSKLEDVHNSIAQVISDQQSRYVGNESRLSYILNRLDLTENLVEN